MSDEIRRILEALIDPPSLRRGVSVSYLSTHLDIDPRRVLKVVGMLERAGYVQMQRLERVTLLSLTTLGYEKVIAQRKARQKSTHSAVVTLAKAAGVSLLVVLIGFVWWWLALFPQTGGVQLTKAAPLPSATLGPTQAVAALPTDTPAAVGVTADPPAPATPVSETPDGPGPLPSAIPIDTPDPFTAIPTPVPLVEQSTETVNIVLMGADTTDGSWRTDTLIVVSVEPNLPAVSMLSIPRDLYVYVPGWKMSRINTADFHGEQVGYPGGGPGLVKATLEYNLGIRVHYFARADFQGFVDILDTLGGVDIVVDCELHDTFPNPDAVGGSSDIDLLPGVHQLDGKQALWYARSRWNTSDFDRGRRQQRVLRAALGKIRQLDLLPKLPELWDDLTQTVETDLSLETALWLAAVAGRLDTSTAIKSRFIDGTVVREWLSPQGAEVLLPAYERIGPLIAEALAPPDTARARQGAARVEVLNGTTWPEWAILAADRLVWEGFDVVSIGQADHTDHQQTTIVDLTGTDKGSPVSRLAEILRVDKANVVLADDAVDDGPDLSVIVGYDYRSCYRTYWRAVRAPTPTPTQQ